MGGQLLEIYAALSECLDCSSGSSVECKGRERVMGKEGVGWRGGGAGSRVRCVAMMDKIVECTGAKPRHA